MKIVVLSDIHLTNRFDIQLFTELKKVIARADQVIINGDFWDGYLITFDMFINSQWQQLFKILKKKKTIYIFGNHDPEKFCDHRVFLFSTQQSYQYQLKIGNYTYSIQHGHLVHQSVLTKFATKLPPSLVRLINTWIKKQEKKETILGKIARQTEIYLDRSGDQQIRSYVKKNLQLQHKKIFVFGHTHVPQLSIQENYLNSGKFTAETPQYISIDSN